MRHMLILGGGTAGTIMANKLADALDQRDWRITVVDGTDEHYYQPGFLFVPFDLYRMRDLVRPRRQYLPGKIRYILSGIDRIDPDKKSVLLANGELLRYDCLILATGADIHPEQIEGLQDEEWGRSKFDFYTPNGAARLAQFLKGWQGGRLVVSIAEMPIKCPVAPLEFLFLADAYFTERGMRDKVDLHLATPLSGAFTKPTSSSVLGEFLDRKGISVTPDFAIGRVDSAGKKIVSWDEVEVPYDLLVSIPTNMGDPCIARSGMGNELNFVPTNKHTLEA
ncbi:MAG TPA: FAD/NAD(P)-binding oxidoreductase, partial [Terracidiphilus sp.]|nr:FAD/NAD(P)-binding oxidoreductase [Terracidiphilus sp.]